MSSCGSKRTTSRRQSGARSVDLDRGVRLAGHDVGVGHDQLRRRHPAAALHAEATRGPVHADDARAGRPHAATWPAPDASGRRRWPPVHGPTAADRSVPERQESGRTEAAADRARAGSSTRWMSARSGADADESSATAPMIHAMPSPTHAVSAAPSSPSTCLKPGTRSAERTREPRPLQAAGEHAAGQQRAEQPEQRRVRGMRSAAEQQRRQAGAEKRAERETDERQHPDDESLVVSVEGQQGGEADDHPVQTGHSWQGNRELGRGPHLLPSAGKVVDSAIIGRPADPVRRVGAGGAGAP